VDLTSIDEFARLSRLSAKALRLYDELGLLPRKSALTGQRLKSIMLPAGTWPATSLTA
jgi:hypothetical protein